MSGMNPMEVERARLEMARDLRLAQWNPDDHPYRYAVLRGLYPLQGLMFLDHKLLPLWLHARKVSEDRLWAIVRQVVDSPVPERDFKEVLRDRVAAEFEYDLDLIYGEAAHEKSA